MSQIVYRIETRFGFYIPPEKIGPYDFPENKRASFQGARIYRKVEVLKVIAKLRKRGIDANLHESTC